MANVGPIQTFSSLSNVKTIPDLVRFLSAYTSQVSQQFNNLISSKTVWGVVGISGAVLAGNTMSFGVSFVGTGKYFIGFTRPMSIRPAVSFSPETSAVIAVGMTSASTAGFMALPFNNVGGSVNSQFSFIATGGKA